MLDIGDVAKQSGLPASTLRFYEEKGLIQSVGRNGLRRLFAPQVLEQLAFIALGRRAGFTLVDIAAMFSANGRFQIDRKQLKAKAAELDLEIKRLIAARDGLQHVANCPAPSHLECPRFQKILNLAGKRQTKQRTRAIR